MSYNRYRLQGGHMEEDDQVAYHRKPTKSKKKLPPLRDRSTLPLTDVKQPLPVQLGAQTIVSIPDTEGTRENISIGGNIRDARIGKTGKQSKHDGRCLELAVYFMDNEYLKMAVRGGENWSAGDLFEEVMKACDLPDVARHVFSLWLVSDLLEVQLKPDQCPFKLACFWDELLEKYTQEDDKTCDRDEPLVMFQRNAFFPLEKEQQITEPEIIRLLYHEAKENVLDGRYPLSQNDYDNLAGLKALMDCKIYDDQIHTPLAFRSKLSDYFPEHMTYEKGFRLFRSKQAPEFRLVNQLNRAYRAYGRLVNEEAMRHCQKSYLEQCWRLPFYGAAFFKGQMEKASSWFVDDDPVYVAINLYGLFITDLDDVKLRLALPHGSFTWQFAEPPPDQLRKSKTMMPAVFIHYTNQETKEKAKLRVFSREGDMIDNMLNSCRRVVRLTKGRRRR